MGKQLKKDIADIDKIIEDAKGISMYIGFGMSAGSGSGKSEDSIDAATSFTLEVSKDSAMQMFRSGIDDLEVYQKFIYPSSEITVDEISVGEKGVSTTKIQKLFSGGKIVKENELGLKRVDSAEVFVEALLPVSFKSVSIEKPAKDSFTLEGDIAKLDKWEEGEIEFTIPQKTYRKILNFQAVNSDGILMNASSYSAMPQTVVRTTAINELEATRSLMSQSLKLQTTSEIKALLNKIPANVFQTKKKIFKIINSISAYQNKMHRVKESFDARIEMIRTIMEENADIIAPDEQNITLKFPDDPERLLCYMSEKFDTISTVVMAYNQEAKMAYDTYYDKEKEKYGIMDSAGNILISALYEDGFTAKEESFFTDGKNSYFLNVKEKKLEPVKNKIFVQTLSNNMAVFKDKDDRLGVLQNLGKEILPFEFNEITEAGDLLITKRRIRGRSYYDLRDYNNNILIKDLKDLRVSSSNDGMIVSTKRGMYGLLDIKGKRIMPDLYTHLEFVGKGPLLAYAIDGSGFGLMDSKQTKITPGEFNEIGLLSEGLIPVSKDDWGYISPNGKIVIPLKYKDANPFYNGTALVEIDNEQFAFINNRGEVVKKVPQSAGDFWELEVDGESAIYNFEKTKFDSRDILIK